MNESVKTKSEIIELLLQNQHKLRSFGVKRIGLFGSFREGNQSRSSDVDILVEFFQDQHSFDNFMDLSFFLEDLLRRKVELVTPESLSSHLAPHIQSKVENVPIAA